MIRLFLALPLAGALGLALFSFMAWMVDNGHQRSPDDSETLSFNMVMVEQEQEVQRRQRAVPEKPEMPEPPPEAQPSQSQAEVTPLNSMSSLPSLDLNTSVDGLAINAPTFSDFGSNQQAMPLYRVEPRYPAKALKRGAEGHVIMSFTIDETGRPIDIQVTDANPRRMFEREAMRALKKWKYQPKVVDGKAIAQVGQTVKLEFKLAK
ncbi:outer membrane transport energization protein TonB [Vibrio crassostreae]|uniref:energy transducer TonB n=1 Tax=Vibrio crassostreae TaxID=246167 RepID=UPI000F493EE1|nr:energy transducer TonB [Vibrio crassostreae]ROO70513.1 outer membrane transport energization protein TonB [Vibrio crassostreae]ROP08557.1 outer membrane transport energization protein TonB [Vibrio crassostreae]ROQ75585.1 outer membrane transport energization protein TonB [Vibrio crassostreae]ROR79955.1 outer membrane transport energization protein TonB [Vibrio crassostreae]RPE91356.1 outer membrane transport energization protein TonB [Vibrio crassostreae]